MRVYARSTESAPWEELTGRTEWELIGLSGLEPPQTAVTTEDMGDADGAAFGYARAEPRALRLTFVPSNPPADNRRELYRIFAPKARRQLRFADGGEDLRIWAYTETVACDLTSRRQAVTASMLCPEPWLEEERTRAETGAGWYNPGQVDSGLYLQITAGAGYAGGDALKVNGITVALAACQAGDVFAIRTGQGEKGYWLNGASILSQWPMENDWPQCVPGANTVQTLAGTWSVTASWRARYGGM